MQGVGLPWTRAVPAGLQVTIPGRGPAPQLLPPIALPGEFPAWPDHQDHCDGQGGLRPGAWGAAS